MKNLIKNIKDRVNLSFKRLETKAIMRDYGEYDFKYIIYDGFNLNKPIVYTNEPHEIIREIEKDYPIAMIGPNLNPDVSYIPSVSDRPFFSQK